MPDKTTGFASPALGYEEKRIDLNSLLNRNPPATYFWRLGSDDMAAVGMPRGSLLMVDRSLQPSYNKPVVIQHEGHFLCRLMTKKDGKTVFTNGTVEFAPTTDDTEIVGSVTVCIINYAFPH